MYLQLGSYKLGQHNNALFVGSQSLSNYYDIEIRFYSKSGGMKKGFFYGMSNCPIKSVSFEENKHYLGAGDIQFHYVDFPIEIDDKVEVYYNGTKKWQGLVDNQITKDGKVELIPFSDQLSDRIFNSTFTNSNIETILNGIIDGTSSVDVTWGTTTINVGDSTLYDNWPFKYVYSRDAIDDVLKKLNNREWAVNISNQFVVYEKSTTISKIIQNTNDNWYSKLERKIDTKRIKATRHEVVQKSTESGKTEYVGNVGYDLAGNDFATLSIEKTRRRKDTLFNISFHSTNSTFLKAYAYSNLQTMANLGETIELKNWRIDKYDPSINTYLKVIDVTEKQLKTIITCDSVTNWSDGATLFSDDYIEGIGCIQAIGSDPDNSEIYYDFGEIKRFKKLEQINFAIKSDEDVGEVYQFGISENSSSLWDNPYSIFINDTDIWEEKYIIPTEQSFRYMGFRLKNSRDTHRQFNWLGRNMLGAYAQPSLYTEYYIDRIQTFGFNYNEYEGLVIQKKYKIDKEGITMTLILNDYDSQSNQMYFDLNKEVEKIKEIQR